jgi:hypothetical protein
LQGIRVKAGIEIKYKGQVPADRLENELLNALGARVQSDRLFCFWIRYEDPTADFGSKGAPWLCQPTPVSTMPKTVMPYQVSWQFVVKKSAGSVHVRGATADGVVADGTFVGMSSAAHASTVYKPPTAARRNAAQIESFAMRKLPAIQHYLIGQACPLAACAANNLHQSRRGS